MLKLENLALGYNHQPLLQIGQLNLFDATHTEVILGRSGSGKTTLLKAIAGLMAPLSGKLLWNNQPILGPNETLVAGHPHIRLVHQDFQLPAYVDVRTFLHRQIPFATAAQKNDRLQQLAENFKLTAHLHHKTQNLSGGQKQRVAIAGALAAQPALLLLDEPFSNLDPMSRLELLRALQAHQKENPVATLAVMHEPELALQLAERLHLLQDGQMQASGAPAPLFFAPPNRVVAGLMGTYALVPKAFTEQPRAFHLLENQVFLRPSQIIAQPNPEGLWKLKSHAFTGNAYLLTLENQGVEVQTAVSIQTAITSNWDVLFEGHPLF